MRELDPSRPLLVMGGPYSNLRATEALRRLAGERDIPPSHVVCTGDVVAYCAEPVETAALVRDWGCHTIGGNCEEQLAAGAADCGCNFAEGSACDRLAKGWYPFANALLPTDLRTWMAGLPATLVLRYGGLTFRVVHGGVDETARWVFASETEKLAEETARAGTDVVLAGHCGVPFLARAGGKTWFNSGALGMPANDGTPDVRYGLVTASPDGAIRLSTHRLAYDHQGAAAAMRRSGHANPYARALVTGLWPSLDVLPPAERAATGQRLRERSLVLRPRRTAMRTGATAPAL
ncbi:MAG: metallophosphoesterase family protein [Hyphomicrobiaceae bacterium]